jgi:hypothetical protein
VLDKVLLVLDENYGEKIIPFLGKIPLWIIGSYHNRKALMGYEGSEYVTTFMTRHGESKPAVCERILFSLDDHFNECSCIGGYNDLNVIGVDLGDVSLKPFLELGFSTFSVDSDGFIARRLIAYSRNVMCNMG